MKTLREKFGERAYRSYLKNRLKYREQKRTKRQILAGCFLKMMNHRIECIRCGTKPGKNWYKSQLAYIRKFKTLVYEV